MKLTSLKVKNINYIPNGDINFSLGINTIIGPNGAGKSCLLDIIYNLNEFIYKQDSNNIQQLDKYIINNDSIISPTFSISLEPEIHTGTLEVSYHNKTTIDKNKFLSIKFDEYKSPYFISDLEFLRQIYFDLTIPEELDLYNRISSSLERLNSIIAKDRPFNINNLHKEKVEFSYSEGVDLNWTRPLFKEFIKIDFPMTIFNNSLYYITPIVAMSKLYKEISFLISLKYSSIVQDKLENISIQRRSSSRGVSSIDKYDECYKGRLNSVLYIKEDNFIKNAIQEDYNLNNPVNDDMSHYKRSVVINKMHEFKIFDKDINLNSTEYFSSGENSYSEFELSNLYMNKNSIIILDEPERGLHFSNQKTMLDEINIRTSFYNSQTFIATHSPNFIINTKGYIITINNIIHNINLSYEMRRYFSEEFIYKALFSKKVILVEGIADYIFIKSFFDYFKYENYSKDFIDLINNTSLIYSGGKNAFDSYIKLLSNLNLDNYYIIADVDFIKEISKESSCFVNDSELKVKLRSIISKYENEITENALERELTNGTRSRDTLSLLESLKQAVKLKTEESFNNAIDKIEFRVHDKIRKKDKSALYNSLQENQLISQIETFKIFLLDFELESYMPSNEYLKDGKACPEYMIGKFSDLNYNNILSIIFELDERAKKQGLNCPKDIIFNQLNKAFGSNNYDDSLVKVKDKYLHIKNILETILKN